MAKSLSILIVTTSHAVLGSTGKATGVWLEELAAPYYAFRDAGASVTIASIAGGAVPIDPRSAQGDLTASVTRFLADPDAKRAVEATPAIGAADISSFDAIFCRAAMAPCGTCQKALSSRLASAKPTNPARSSRRYAMARPASFPRNGLTVHRLSLASG